MTGGVPGGAGLLAAVVAAVITASVAVGVAVLTQWRISQREQRQRAEDRRRSTLLDAQDAAVALRGRLHDYGLRLRTASQELSGPRLDYSTPLDPVVVAASDDADGRLTAYLVRVEDAAVVTAIEAWRAAANARFISTAETSETEENDAWLALNRSVGVALRAISPSARGSE